MTAENVLQQPSHMNQAKLYKTLSIVLLFCDNLHLCDSLLSVASFQTDLTNDLTSS